MVQKDPLNRHAQPAAIRSASRSLGEYDEEPVVRQGSADRGGRGRADQPQHPRPGGKHEKEPARRAAEARATAPATTTITKAITSTKNEHGHDERIIPLTMYDPNDTYTGHGQTAVGAWPST